MLSIIYSADFCLTMPIRSLRVLRLLEEVHGKIFLLYRALMKIIHLVMLVFQYIVEIITISGYPDLIERVSTDSIKFIVQKNHRNLLNLMHLPICLYFKSSVDYNLTAYLYCRRSMSDFKNYGRN